MMMLFVKRMKVLIMTVVWWALLVTPTVTRITRKGVWLRVEAVAGREAVLPCEVGAFENTDRVFVVLWYRNGDKEPVYSYDNRPGRLVQAPEDRHTVKSRVLEGRATFRPGQVPALHIRPVLPADQANYTCRVDFRIASSRRTHLSLQVVEPPGHPLLRLGGRRVTEGVLGSLQEDAALDMTCSVEGGVPPPTLIWTRDEEVVDAEIESREGGVTVNKLQHPPLTRGYHGALLSCTATNNNVTSPVTASVSVVLNLRPLVTRLVEPPRSLRVGHGYQVVCVSAGSRPHPNVSWTLGNLATLPPLLAQTEHRGNVSTSRVTVRATRRLHGQRLSCSSLNRLFPDFSLTDSVLLNVTYPPVVTLELAGGGRGSRSEVLEGKDVALRCNVDANPSVYKISWFRHTTPLHHSPETGQVMVSANTSLVLKGVTRHQAGTYTCAASNVEGDARSSPIRLVVNYAPVCGEVDEAARRVYAAGVGLAVNVSCGVLASPALVKYSWVFNNTVKSERLPGNQVFVRPDGRSVAQHWARGPQDYGTLQCWAQNAVGRMAQPCLFRVIPAGRPERPLQCSVVNTSYDSLSVTCTPGFDGGLKQAFRVTVKEAVTGREQAQVSSKFANLTLRGLTPGLDYTVEIMAFNSLGDSDPAVLEAFTYKMAENRMRDEKVEEASSLETTQQVDEEEERVAASIVVVVLGTAVGLLVAAVGLLAVVVARCHHHEEGGDVGSGGTTLPPAAPAPIPPSASTPAAAILPKGVSLAADCPIRTPHTEVEFEMGDLVLGGVCSPSSPP